MKILFLYKDAGHARPLRHVLHHLRQRGIDIQDFNDRSHADCRSHLHIKADLLLVYSQLMASAIKYQHGPILMIDRIDGAQLAESREWMDRPNVLGVMKSYRLRPAVMNNQLKGRWTALALDRFGVKATKKSMLQSGDLKQLSDDELQRIYLMPGFAAIDHLNDCVRARVDFDAPRRYDAHFAGTLSYSGSEVETHRRGLVKILRQYPGRVVADGNTMRCNVYRGKMLDSKAVVSPWGCGEACHRDYEAMLLGAVLIKPNTGHVDCWPDIYQEGKTYLPCKPDWSDLYERIDWVKANWPKLWEMRKYCRALILMSRERDYVADMMASEFHKVMEHAGV